MRRRDISQWVLRIESRTTLNEQLGGALYDFIDSHAGILSDDVRRLRCKTSCCIFIIMLLLFVKFSEFLLNPPPLYGVVVMFPGVKVFGYLCAAC